MPTSCTGPLQTSVEGDSWEALGGSARRRNTRSRTSRANRTVMDGCNRLSFEPSIRVAPDGQQASTPTGLTVDVHVPQEASLNPTGLAESAVKDTTVALPAGVAIEPRRRGWPVGVRRWAKSASGKPRLNRPVRNPRRSGPSKSIRRCCRTRLTGAAYLATQERQTRSGVSGRDVYRRCKTRSRVCWSSSPAKSNPTR